MPGRLRSEVCSTSVTQSVHLALDHTVCGLRGAGALYPMLSPLVHGIMAGERGKHLLDQTSFSEALCLDT